MDEAALDRVRSRMASVDTMPPGLRACVHEHGLTVVNAMLQAGVTNPRHIDHLVSTVRQGSAEVGNRNRSEEQKREMERRYAGYLRGAGYAVVPLRPTPGMVQASISALDDAGIAHTVVDRTRKHTLRLMLANAAGDIEAFGQRKA